VAAAGHVLVLTGGDPVDPATAAWLPAGATVVAADSGLAQAARLGLHVDLAVGDFDSVDPALLARAEASGTVVERHPAAKDHTDLELAVRVAQRLGAERLTVVGGHGGRLDHALANVLALAQTAFAGARVDAVVGRARVAVVHDRVELVGERGDVVSLLPVGGPARAVTTEGLLYPLHGEDLGPGTTRGVSNEMTGSLAAVSLAAGVLLAVRPGVRGTHVDGSADDADGDGDG
jgi:thiamine pyrophosphokinase